MDKTTIIKAYCAAVGSRIAHVTAASNLDSIKAHGLHSAHALAVFNGVDPSELILRDERMQLDGPTHQARLNHQRPIRHGLAAANTIVDGHDATSWAAMLDQRVFFWPAKRGQMFSKSIGRDVETVTLWLDANAFANLYFDTIDLAPINSGNFKQGGAKARRGDWLYVPLSAGLPAFRKNRIQRGLVTGRDAVREISLRKGINAEALDTILVEIDHSSG